ncbi:MAG: Gfo/Idh/MocA family oxidoreductase [Oscillospiraceae bacterium]|nr:Gfo/Idh/MocA family oxidoreductase [Oscillospiraceae bacterium]
METKNANFGVIGISGRGAGMLRELMAVPGVNVIAVCDKYEDRARRGAEIVKEAQGTDAAVYLDYKELLARDDIDAVLCCTTWITHGCIAVDSMRAGKHVAFEVGGAASVEECWQMVRASEETGKFCMLLENCCYDRNEMAIYNMKRLGVFGEVVHLEGGYRHDLRHEICLGRENRHGRLYNFMNRNGELYPTHQLGPISKLIGINRGNRFLTLCSMASKSRGLNAWIKKNLGEDYDLADYPFNQGDVVTTMIKCAGGETIVLTHDCSSPRPYSRNYVVEGTNGVFKETSSGGEIYLDEFHEDGEEWKPFPPIREKYEHPLWRQYARDGIHAGGHGGMDYLVLSAFAEAAVNNLTSPIDVYDSAAWMAVTCLSEQSIAMGSMPVPVPDFTNGMWIDREPYRRGRYCLDEVCEDFFPEA